MNKEQEQVTWDFKATVISNYRITIPEIARAYLDIKEGDIVKVEIQQVIKKGK